MKNSSLILLALAIAPAIHAQGNFLDNVFRNLVIPGYTGYQADAFQTIDDNNDGAVDTYISARLRDMVVRFDGRGATTTTFRGSNGSWYGGLVKVGEIFAAGQNHLAVMSTRASREYLFVYDPRNPNGIVASAPIPSGHSNLRGLSLIQADNDPELELVYATRGYQGGLGAVVIIDLQTMTFKVVATGTSAADEFATQVCVVRNQFSGDRIVVSAPGSDKVHEYDPRGVLLRTTQLPAGTGAGRNALVPVDRDNLAILSSRTTSATPHGRIDVLYVPTGTVSAYFVGQGNLLVTSCGEADSTGRFFFTVGNFGLEEHLYEAVSLTMPPRIVVQAPNRTGLATAGKPFKPFQSTDLRVVPLAQRFRGRLTHYKPDGPVDLQIQNLRGFSGNDVTVNFHGGPSAAGAAVFPLFSTQLPALTTIPGFFDIAFTPGPLTTLSQALVPGAPFLADSSGNTSFKVRVPTLGLGGVIINVSWAVVWVGQNGKLNGSQDPSMGHFVLQ